jgi:F-type H+-transporting ATPase subunit a
MEYGSHVYATLEIAGHEIPFITDAVIVMCLVTLVIVVTLAVTTRKFEAVPAGPQKYLEALVGFIRGFTAPMGHHGEAFAPLIGTFLLFLAVNNIMAIFNVIPSGEFLARVFNNPSLEHFEFAVEPPTRNFNVTACMALIAIAAVIGAEFKYKGLKGWLRGFYKPTPVSGFIRILDYAVRPMSLCLRLFGNIMGGTITMSLLYGAVPLLLPVIAAVYLDLFDGLLQAYIFVFLLSLYLTEAVEPAVE